MYKSKSISYDDILDAREDLVDNINKHSEGGGKVCESEVREYVYNFLKRLGLDYNSANSMTTWDIVRSPNVYLTKEDIVRNTDTTIGLMFPCAEDDEKAKIRELAGEVLWSLGIDISNSGDCDEWVVTKNYGRSSQPGTNNVEYKMIRKIEVYTVNEIEQLREVLKDLNVGGTLTTIDQALVLTVGMISMIIKNVIVTRYDDKVSIAGLARDDTLNCFYLLPRHGQ